jgi:putative transposase
VPSSKPPYPAEFRQQIVELAGAGRGLKQLAREFGVSANSIRNWVHGDRDRVQLTVRSVAENAPLSASERAELHELRRRLKQVQTERDILAKATAWQEREDVHHVSELVKANQADFPVRTMCRALRVSPSGYYDWLDRAPSARAQANAELTQRNSDIHRASDANYGAPRIQAELRDAGVVAGHNRIARLMRRHGLRGVSRRRGRCVTTRRERDQRAAPDLVQRCFEARDINQLWVADMTYIPTWAGFGYLAVVLDVFSRKVVSRR